MDFWPKALEVANKNDRIHLRNTCYNYAKFCEERNDLAAAIELYLWGFLNDDKKL